nr:hypothetical protein [Angustibacter aerolatus]
MRDLAPEIHRQRLVVEGLCQRPIDDVAIRQYLSPVEDHRHGRASPSR